MRCAWVCGRRRKPSAEAQTRTGGVFAMTDDFPEREIRKRTKTARMQDYENESDDDEDEEEKVSSCLLYTSPSPRDKRQSRMPSSA